MSDSSLQMQTAVVGDAEYTYMNILIGNDSVEGDAEHPNQAPSTSRP